MNNAKHKEALTIIRSKQAANNGDGMHVDSVAEFISSDPDGLIERKAKSVNHEVSSAVAKIESATQQILDVTKKLGEAEDEIIKCAKKRVSTVKDYTNQVAESLLRINKLVGNDFERKLEDLKAFAETLERIERLQANGTFDKFINAMK